VNWRELLGVRQELGKRRREKARFKKKITLSFRKMYKSLEVEAVPSQSCYWIKIIK
jgi:hypothetical protein